jgi:hypothetical protein
MRTFLRRPAAGLHRWAITEILAKRMADIALIATVVLMAALLLNLKSRYRNLAAEFDRRSVDAHPKVGDYLPDVPAATVDNQNGGTSVFSVARLPAVLYFFSPQCKFCIIQKKDLPAFAKSAKACGYSFVAISTMAPNATRGMFPYPLSFPVLVENGGGIPRSYRVEGTPMFITVSPSRRVEAVHTGLIPDAAVFRAEMLNCLDHASTARSAHH